MKFEPVNFILNRSDVTVTIPPGTIVLDYIRSKNLTGTKVGCREGDCGACMVLWGCMVEHELIYHAVNSCLLPVGELHGTHIVTIEGLGMDKLSLVQQIIVEEGAIQCGFCTPGIVIALTGYLLTAVHLKLNSAISALDGNLCRCTGYASIKRAAKRLIQRLSDFESSRGNSQINRIQFLVERGVLPEYFLDIKNRLGDYPYHQSRTTLNSTIIAGGTDAFVQHPYEYLQADLFFLSRKPELKQINVEGSECHIGAAVTVHDLEQSSVFNQHMPSFKKYSSLISSSAIRYRATVGGNIINASPIGDLTILFLALGARVVLASEDQIREIPLDDFFLDYKILNKKPNELLTSIIYKIPGRYHLSNFNKVSKRRHVDIASVNSAIVLQFKNDIIIDARISAGGVAPIPKMLTNTAEFLKDKTISAQTLLDACLRIPSDITPISDVRGTAEYKYLLLRQLIFDHFLQLFPQHISIEDIL